MTIKSYPTNLSCPSLATSRIASLSTGPSRKPLSLCHACRDEDRVSSRLPVTSVGRGCVTAKL